MTFSKDLGRVLTGLYHKSVKGDCFSLSILCTSDLVVVIFDKSGQGYTHVYVSIYTYHHTRMIFYCYSSDCFTSKFL